jgi:hypothetical protein
MMHGPINVEVKVDFVLSKNLNFPGVKMTVDPGYYFRREQDSFIKVRVDHVTHH